MPVLTLVAGPNGSGKSSIVQRALEAVTMCQHGMFGEGISEVS